MAKKVTEDKKPKKAAAPKKEKTVKKKSPATRKKVVEDIPDEEPKGIIQDTAADAAADAPADLRGRKRAGRPNNTERARTESIDEKVALICADWLDDIKAARKTISVKDKIKGLPNMLKHLVRDDDVDDESEVTLILLADRYLGAQKQFKDAEEQSRREVQQAVTRNAKQSNKPKQKDDE